MADEVIISERARPALANYGTTLPIQGRRITTQVLDVAAESAAFNTATEYILITANGVDIWYDIGASPDATANTAGNEFLPADQSREEPVEAGEKIDTAADV